MSAISLASVAILAVAGCGGQTPASVKGTPQAAATAGGLQCRLPVAGFVEPAGKGTPDPAGENKGAGGFLDLRSGAYTPVSSSDQSYVAAADAWLPVPPESIAPDGRSYIASRAAMRAGQQAATTTLYVVDVRSRAERLLFTAPDGDFAFVLSWSSSGVYVEVGGASGSSNARPMQLLVIDPASGGQRSLPGQEMPPGVTYQAWLNMSNDAAWGMAVRTDPKNPQATPAVDLVRLGLSDGARATWFKGSGAFVLLGFDWNGHPILQTSGLGAGTTSLIAVVGPNQTSPIAVEGGTFMVSRGSGVSDAHGLWLGSGDGAVWLYAPPGHFTKVGAVPAQAGATGVSYDPHAWRSIAGPCQ